MKTTTAAAGDGDGMKRFYVDAAVEDLWCLAKGTTGSSRDLPELALDLIEWLNDAVKVNGVGNQFSFYVNDLRGHIAAMGDTCPK